ncbi:MAG TPA: hypothetical protein VFF73_12815 [Planctomycetota bacterium]|nr:hypothetical protein [Planctomycetota bacterium]
MPEEKLSYSRGVLEKIRQSYDKLSREELLDLICYISKTYIVEQTIPFDVPIPEAEETPPDAEVVEGEAPAANAPSPAQRFATLIEGLKKRTQLPQLASFSVEDGKAVLVVDNQKIVFGDRVTVEFVPTRTRPRSGEVPVPTIPATPPPPAAAPAPSGARPDLPGGDGRTRQGGPKPPPPVAPPPKKAPETKKAPEPKKGDLEDVDHIVERFKRLDLD